MVPNEKTADMVLTQHKRQNKIQVHSESMGYHLELGQFTCHGMGKCLQFTLEPIFNLLTVISLFSIQGIQCEFQK